MNLLNAHGEFPTVIYKVFNNRKYAEDFINGRIRFSNLRYYQSIEDEKRKDISEGESFILYDKVREYKSRFASNSFYVFCTHKSLESAQEGKFGKYIVEIKNPKKLAIRISDYLSFLPEKHFGGVEGVSIKYTYGNQFCIKPTSVEMAALTYSQKPAIFSEENEFRFVFIRKESHLEHVFINLGQKIENCSFLK